MLHGFSRMRFGRPRDSVHDESQSSEEQHNNDKITPHDQHLLLEGYPRPLRGSPFVLSIQALPLTGRATLAWGFFRCQGAWNDSALFYGARAQPDSFQFHAPLLIVEGNDVLHRVGVLRALVRSEKPLDPREACGVADPVRIGSSRLQGPW